MEGAKARIRTPAFGDDEGGACWDDGQQGKVRQIFISHGDSILSIQTACGSRNVTLLDRHGGHGHEFNVVNLESRSLRSIRGRYGNYRGWSSEPVVVRSLTFETDDGKVYGPFGTEAGTAFSFHLDGATFGGFHGRSCDRFLRAIGIYVATEATSYAGNKKLPTVTRI